MPLWWQKWCPFYFFPPFTSNNLSVPLLRTSRSLCISVLCLTGVQSFPIELDCGGSLLHDEEQWDICNTFGSDWCFYFMGIGVCFELQHILAWVKLQMGEHDCWSYFFTWVLGIKNVSRYCCTKHRKKEASLFFWEFYPFFSCVFYRELTEPHWKWMLMSALNVCQKTLVLVFVTFPLISLTSLLAAFKGAYFMWDCNNGSTELLSAAFEAIVDVSISSSLSQTHWEAREREGERSVPLSSTLPTELQLDSCCVSAKPMVPLCPSIGVPLSPRHCPLCALQPRADYRLAYLLWVPVNCVNPTTASAKTQKVHCWPLFTVRLISWEDSGT